jgi:hypothetical protein
MPRATSEISVLGHCGGGATQCFVFICDVRKTRLQSDKQLQQNKICPSLFVVGFSTNFPSTSSAQQGIELPK